MKLSFRSATLAIVLLGCLLHDEVSCFSLGGSGGSSRSRHTSTSSSSTSSTSLNANAHNVNADNSILFSHPGSSGTGSGWIDPSAPVNTPSSLQKTLAESLKGSTFRKRISILGSTGSIGTQTLDIVDACPDNFVVDALSAGTNAQLMARQVLKYNPRVASMSTPEAAEELRSILLRQTADARSQQCADDFEMPTIVHGPEGIVAAATVSTADTVVTGIVGSAGLLPTIEAIKCGKDIALANKETLISGGPVINPLVEKYGVNLLPADSEHSAIFQCLQGVPPGGLRRIVLTASGGAFRDLTGRELFDMCADDPAAVQRRATTHPNWDMGAKITLDSATMMNKGLEVRA
jgi:1-deoxy-D-xylulose-5-phosphate reductoisomerase